MEDQSLTIDRKITIFKTLALSKVVYLDSCSQSNDRWTDKVPTNVIQKNRPAKIKHKTLVIDDKEGSSNCAGVNLKK